MKSRFAILWVVFVLVSAFSVEEPPITGVYKMDQLFDFIEITKEGNKYYATPSDHSKKEMFHEANLTYKIPATSATISFLKNAKGTINEILVLIRSGMDLHGKRIDVSK